MRYRAIKITVRKVGTPGASVFVQSLDEQTGSYVGSTHELADTPIRDAVRNHLEFAAENARLVAAAQAREEEIMKKPGQVE